MNTADICLTAFHQFGEIEFMQRHIKTVIRCVMIDRFGNLRAVKHHFFRYTADVYAGSAQMFRFNNRTFFAVTRRTVDRRNTAAAATDCDIIIMFAHVVSLNTLLIVRIILPKK